MKEASKGRGQPQGNHGGGGELSPLRAACGQSHALSHRPGQGVWEGRGAEPSSPAAENIIIQLLRTQGHSW